MLLFQTQTINSQSQNLDSLAKTFIDVEDVDKKFYLELDTFEQAIEKYKLLKPIDQILIDSKQVYAKLFVNKDPISSMRQFEESIEWAEKIDYSKGKAIGKHEIGLLYLQEGLYENAIKNIVESSEIYEKMGEWWVYGFSLIDIGNVYYQLRRFEIARKYYHQAYHVFINHQFAEKYEFAVSVYYNNLGLTYIEEKQYDSAMQNFMEGLRWRQKLNLEEYYGHSYKYIARCFVEMQKTDSALKYYQLAVDFDSRKGPKSELIKSHIGLGKIYYYIDEHEKALEQFLRAFDTAKDYELYPAYIKSANEIGQYYLHINHLDSASRYFLIALQNAKNYGQLEERQVAGERLLEISKITKNLGKQIEYLNELLDIERQKQTDVVLQKQLEYEVNKRITDKRILESSNKIQQAIIISVIIVLVLVLLILLYIHRSRRKYIQLSKHLEFKNSEANTQKSQLEKINQELNHYSDEIFHQKEEILTQSESLSNAFSKLKELQKFKEGMAAMIVHDLKNPLNTILNQTKNVLVYESANQMLNMVNNILDLQKYESALMPTNKNDERLADISENAVFNIRYLTEQKNISIKNYISRNYKVFADKDLVERIVTNLLTNAIKYSPLNSLIQITALPIDSQFIRINVIDNGPGISENEKNKIFEKFSQLITQNSGLTRSTGLGLSFCKMAVEAHNGKIDVNSNEGGGAIFWFTLPLSKVSENARKPLEKEYTQKMDLSTGNLQKLRPFINHLRNTAVYEVADIHRIALNIKDLGIPEIDLWIHAIENASYAVNEEEYKRLLAQIGEIEA